MTAYGIDLGATYSCLAKFDSLTGIPKIIEDEIDGSVSIPSVVAFPADMEGVIIGDVAKELATEQPERVFRFFKRYMGCGYLDKSLFDPDYPGYFIDSEEYPPVMLSALVLKQIKKYASYSGENVADVIIAVPAYFDMAQRASTREAGKLAGLNVMATINEPTAAALSFVYGQPEKNRLILIFDLGGCSFGVTLIRQTPADGNKYDMEILLTDGNHKLGGCDWDERMFGLLKRKYAEEYGIAEDDIDSEDLNDLRSQCERTKWVLSMRDRCKVRVVTFKPTRCNLTVTKGEFEDVTRDLLQQSTDVLDSLLAAAKEEKGIDESQITDVLMVGGSTRMPQVINMLYNRFGKERVRFHDPDCAVALGAAVASVLYNHLH